MTKKSHITTIDSLDMICKQIAEHIKTPLAIVDLDFNINYVNSTFLKKFKLDEKQCIGKNWRALLHSDIDSPDECGDMLFVKSGDDSFMLKDENCCIAGTHYVLNITTSPLFSRNGELIGFLETFDDINKVIKNNGTLVDEQLLHADKMVTLSTLVSGIAHEINNPNSFAMLNAPILIKIWEGALPILKKYYEEHGEFSLGGLPFSKMEEKIPQLLDGILIGADRIKNIVEDLKIYADKKDYLQQETIDLNNVIRAAIRLIHGTTSKHNSNLSITLADPKLLVKGNFQLLEQVVVNIIQNAYQATEANGGNITVSSYIDFDHNMNVLRVEDDGIGIESKLLPQLCDPFFTTKRDTKHYGLGLSVSSQIIESMQGSITFKSEPNNGFVVWIKFPQKQTEKI